MPGNLIFPDGVTLATRDDIPGPNRTRDENWERLNRSNINAGFVVQTSSDNRFRYYAEANVHAPDVWRAFVRLSTTLLQPSGTLLFDFKDDAPDALGDGEVARILTILAPHAYQLAHDGYLQFGIVSQTDDALSEVFVAPTKHFKIWFNDDTAFRAAMIELGLDQTEKLQFIDEYPRVTKRLPSDKAVRVDELAQLLTEKLAGSGTN